MPTKETDQEKGPEVTATASAPVEWGKFVETAEEVEAGHTVTLADIPQPIKDAVEKSFKLGRGLKFSFPDQKVAEQFLNLARQYAVLRTNGRLTIRQQKLSEGTPAGTIAFKAKEFEDRTRKQ